MTSSSKKNFGIAASHVAVAPAPAAPRGTALAAPATRELDADQLFAGTNTLLIRHGGERYTLRRTSKGKLILTK